jgi:hypothetical protein
MMPKSIDGLPARPSRAVAPAEPTPLRARPAARAR